MVTPDPDDPNYPLGSFPLLTPDNHEVTSQRSRQYNCIAWAAGIDDRQIWPTGGEGYEPEPAIDWPEGIPDEESMDSFIAYFSSLGYETCGGPQMEPGYLKVAIFEKDGDPTHACRQTPSGRWTSKLGWDSVDIEHDDLDCIAGRKYGQATVFMRRLA